jgi:hypothetical protein
MSVYAYVSILEATLRLLIVYILQMIAVDKLKLYGLLMFAVTFVNTGIYRFLCAKKYKECRFRLYWNHNLFKELTVYVGWNFLGSMSSMVAPIAFVSLFPMGVARFFITLLISTGSLGLAWIIRVFHWIFKVRAPAYCTWNK